MNKMSKEVENVILKNTSGAMFVNEFVAQKYEDFTFSEITKEEFETIADFCYNLSGIIAFTKTEDIDSFVKENLDSFIRENAIEKISEHAYVMEDYLEDASYFTRIVII